MRVKDPLGNSRSYLFTAGIYSLSVMKLSISVAWKYTPFS